MYSPLLLCTPCFHPGHGGHRAARVGRETPPPLLPPLLRGCKETVLPHQSTCWYMGDCICLLNTFLAHSCLYGKLRQ